MSEQLGLFDAAAGTAAKEEAITRVEANASRAWLDHAWKAIGYAVEVARTVGSDVTTDDVWETLSLMGAPEPPREPRAMGPVMRRAVREGLLRPTSTYRPSAMPQNHRRPVRVYEVRGAAKWGEPDDARR